MLREAVKVMRQLWTGEQVSFDGDHYVVDRARLYNHPAETIPVPVSAFGPKALDLAIEVGDGFATASLEAESRASYAKEGKGPTMAGVKVCWGEDEDQQAELPHRLWRNQGLPGELAQELAMPAHFDRASELVDVASVKETLACGPDPERHVEAIREYLDAGFDEVYVNQIGPDQAGFFDSSRPRSGPALGTIGDDQARFIPAAFARSVSCEAQLHRDRRASQHERW